MKGIRLFIIFILVIGLIGLSCEVERKKIPETTMETTTEYPRGKLTYIYDKTHNVSIWIYIYYYGVSISTQPGELVKNPEKQPE